MAAANVFHVEFGFNETELTSALEEDKYHIAEQMVYDNAHTEYLDEGCYQRTALNIVLSGHDCDDTSQAKTMNLYMAKLLVQCGASPNFRVPESDCGIYLNPGMTPLELVVKYYDNLTGGDPHYTQPVSTVVRQSWFPESNPVIGLDNVLIKDYEDLIEQLCSLVFIFLSHGGNANVPNDVYQTVLHRTTIQSYNLHMTKVLCENGADVNARDKEGDTALMARVNLMCFKVREQVIDYLLSRPDIEIDQCNKLGRSALFGAMWAGDARTAEILLRMKCDVTSAGKVWQDVNSRSTVSRYISPLFASMCSVEAGQYVYENFCDGGNMSPHFFTASLVDSGYFDCNSIQEELKQFIYHDCPELTHLIRLAPSLLNLMFGASTSTLMQLAARKIFTHWVLKEYWKYSFIFRLDKHSKYTEVDRGVKITYVGDVAAELVNSVSMDEPGQAAIVSKPRALGYIAKEDDSSYLTSMVTGVAQRALQFRRLQMLDISHEKLKDFVHSQNIPVNSLLCFEIELFRFKLFVLLQMCNPTKGYMEDWDTDDSDVSEENDSDLEYW